MIVFIKLLVLCVVIMSAGCVNDTGVPVDVPVDDGDIGYRGSPTRVVKSFPKTVKVPGMKIEEGVEESAEFILDKLKEKYLL